MNPISTTARYHIKGIAWTGLDREYNLKVGKLIPVSLKI